MADSQLSTDCGAGIDQQDYLCELTDQLATPY